MYITRGYPYMDNIQREQNVNQKISMDGAFLDIYKTKQLFGT